MSEGRESSVEEEPRGLSARDLRFCCLARRPDGRPCLLPALFIDPETGERRCLFHAPAGARQH
jgi:hypothetical protein